MHQANYFGCWPRFGNGHFLYTPEGERIWEHPVGGWKMFDQLYAPARPRPGIWRQTLVTTPHDGPFTLLGCWDQTGDSRQGSNSLFILPGDVAFPFSVEDARDAFPELMERIAQAFHDVYSKSPS